MFSFYKAVYCIAEQDESEYLQRAQQQKMKELWDNKADEFWRDV